MKPQTRSTPPSPGSTLHRSGAVARMLRMPVATLRVWERRYGLTQPQLSASGQRLYSADDVRRLALIRQLTDLGHAIGRLAPLDMAQLQRVAATHAQTVAATQPAPRPIEPPALAQPWRVAIVGPLLAARLRQPGVLRRIGRPLDLLGPFHDVAQAASCLQADGLDAVLIHAPQLHDGWLADIDAAAPGLVRVPKAVCFGFASERVCSALAAAGTALLRDPQPDAVLGQWLHMLSMPPATAAPATPAIPTASALGSPIAPRRWDDAALAEIAGLSSTIACECPRHVADLLMQLSRFEVYSAECAHRSAEDRALHRYLQQVAATARASFEEALERVALHEGLLLPRDPVGAVGGP